MSPSLTMTSPRLMPMRSRMDSKFGSASFAWVMAFWISTAHETASRTLPNSTLSPAALAIRPRWALIKSSITSRPRTGSLSSLPRRHASADYSLRHRRRGSPRGAVPARVLPYPNFERFGLRLRSSVQEGPGHCCAGRQQPFLRGVRRSSVGVGRVDDVTSVECSWACRFALPVDADSDGRRPPVPI